MDPRPELYRRSASHPELALAARAWWGGAEPDVEEWPDFLDFFALSWVDARGRFPLEGLGPLSPTGRRWLEGLREGIWVVDEAQGSRAFVRDLLSEEELAVEVGQELPSRTVLRGRLLPTEEGFWIPSGQPDVYDPMGALARLELGRAWAGSPRRELADKLRELRQGFLRQREQHALWVRHFGSELVVFSSAEVMVGELGAYLQALDALTRGGREGPLLGVKLSASLQEGRPGVIFDEVEGVHFLPRLGDFLDGDAEVFRSYLEEPGIGDLPFRHAGRPGTKAPPQRVAPSIFPSADELIPID